METDQRSNADTGNDVEMMMIPPGSKRGDATTHQGPMLEKSIVTSDDEEIRRDGGCCMKALQWLRLDGCFDRPVKVPKKGEPVQTISLQVPLTKGFVAEEKRKGSQDRRNNTIKTSKYTMWTFVPLAGAFQFKRFVNLFFLVVVILLIVGNNFPKVFLAPWQATGTAVYLAVLVAAGMIVEGLDDLGKHRGDKAENSRPIQRVQLATGELIWTTWGELLPGDIVVVNDRESFPADLIILYGASNERRNMCYIETSGIDGETNLKIKECPSAFVQEMLKKVDFTSPKFGAEEMASVSYALARLARGRYEYEQPNAFLQFNGSFQPTSTQFEHKIPLEFRHLILRGSELRNTKWMFGLVAYAGHETKLSLSRSAVGSKFSRIDKLVNKLMYVLLLVYLVICGLADGLLFREPDTKNWWYFKYTSSTSGYLLPGGLSFYLTFVVLFSNLIPISMVLLIEIMNKYMQFIIDNDIEMYHEATDTPAACRSASLSAEIGQITHFFSDKTGTLTRNEMKLVGLYVDKQMYGYVPPKVDSEGEVADQRIMQDSKEESDIDEEENEEGDTREKQGSLDMEAGGDQRMRLSTDHAQHELFADVIALLNKPTLDEGGQRVLDLIVFLSVCHTVILETDRENNHSSLNAESPDEEAFVRGAFSIGVELVQSGDGSVVIKLPSGVVQRYNVLALNPFNSTRKRMSVVLEREDQSVFLMMKGADNVMLARAATGQQEMLEDMRCALLQYAWAGLRTLVMAQREISEEEFFEFDRIHKDAMVAPSGAREEALANAASLIEKDVQIVGATAIEDQLQVGVPEAIQSLRDAGIQVWVLTGDKIETAINIGLSSRLIDSTMLQVKLLSSEQQELSAQLDEILDTLTRAVESVSKDTSTLASSKTAGNEGTPSSRSTDDHLVIANVDGREEVDDPVDRLDFGAGAFAANCLALIVSGESLEFLMADQKGSKQLEHKFLRVARACKVVLACRVSPKQKSLIVEMVRNAPDNKKLKRKPITLAIGDGANDVPMIQSAHVGIGISGHEGKQATNASDFALAQFRFVVRLLLVHGRQNYRRHAVVITFLIYCWIYYVMILYVFQSQCLWSGQQVYYTYIYTFFAAYYFNFAVISNGWFNTDVSPSTILENPWTYCRGAKNQDLDLTRLAVASTRGLVHVAITFGFIYGTSPYTISQATFGSTCYATVFFVLFFEQLLAGNSFTKVSLIVYILDLVLFLAGMAIFTTPPYLYSSVADAGLTWMQLLLCLCIVIILELVVLHLKHEFFPSPLDVLIEQDRGFVAGKRVTSRRARKDALRVIEATGKFLFAPVPLTAKKFSEVLRGKRRDDRPAAMQSMQPAESSVDFAQYADHPPDSRITTPQTPLADETQFADSSMRLMTKQHSSSTLQGTNNP